MSEAANNVQGSGWAALRGSRAAAPHRRAGVRPPGERRAGRAAAAHALDMWEHAYYLQYKNVKKDWVEAFWNIVTGPTWPNRFDRVKSLQLV